MKTKAKTIFLFLFLILTACKTHHLQKKETLSNVIYGFEHPQDSTRTKVWWFHGETETTKEGITADLTAFKKAGIGGVIYYDQNHGKAENAIKGFSPEWFKMLRFAAEEAKRIGLTFEIHISNGYVAGGPWITNETSMKRLVATEIYTKGERHFSEKLEEPKNKFNFFKDVAILAFPAQKGAGISSNTRKVKLTSNIEGLDLNKIFDPMSTDLAKINRNDSGVYINLKFNEIFEARSISYQLQPRGKATTSATNVPGKPFPSFVGTGYHILPDLGQLEASNDGINYIKVCDIKPIYKAHESWKQKTISFNPIKAQYYRLYLHNWWKENETNQSIMIGSVVLNSTAKLDQWEEKAGLFSEYIEKDQTPQYSKESLINTKSIINLSNQIDANGVLNWNVPPGDWVIMRFSYVPTGATTKHGRENLIGRECDKLSVKAAEIHWDNYVGKIADSLAYTKSGQLTGVAMDSHEAGAQNWTDNFIDEFKLRRGYDPTPYLPAMMGYVVNGVKESNGFLFDVRRNIADMISDNYYGTFERLSKKRGLIFTAQAIGNALCIVGDPIQSKSKVSKPQGEFWAIHPDGNYDIKESSSAAHLYGKKIASAEAYTDAKYSTSLADFKSLADYAYAFGINEFVICASAYQPWLDKIPGSTGGGRQYVVNRNNTWWNYSTPFWDYQSRSAFIMRTGKSSSDLCIYLGENAPVKILTYRLSDIPSGFDFDAFTSDALIKRMEGRNNKIFLPDGINYNIMILPKNGDITFDALQKIASIVNKGGKIYGSKPLTSVSTKDKNEDKEYKKITEKLWGKSNNPIGVNHFGKGKVYWGESLEKTLKIAGITPDIVLQDGDIKTAKIYFNHRTLFDADLFFLHNHKDSVEKNLFTFKAIGKYAQLWNAVSGERFSIPIEKSDANTVSIRLNLLPNESYFIVIANQFEELPPAQFIATPSKTEIISTKWDVYFDEKLGGPGNVVFENLEDWTTNIDPKIKFYSGTAIYKKTISIDSKTKKIEIDLGNPGFVAQVLINGKDAGIIWCSPWRLDISRFIKEGKNYLEIRVANSLTNRMIYDSQLPEHERITYAYPMVVSPNDILISSGLKNVKLIYY